MPRKSAHRKALERINEDPTIIGLNKRDLLFSAVEPYLYSGRRGRRIQPDLVFILRTGGVIVIEYKSNGHLRLTEKGRTQLEEAVSFYEKKGISAEGRLITGDSHPSLKPYSLKTKKKHNKECSKRRRRRKSF